MTKRATWTAAAVIGVTVAVPAGLASQDDCKHREEIELNGSAAGSLEVEAGAGKLVIRGGDRIEEIHVTATLCASDGGRLEALDVSLDGDRLVTDYPRNGGGGWFGRNRYARIDLVVEVPAGTNLRVDDGSGSVEITGVGEVVMHDGSGSVRLRSVASVVVEDGSGSLTIEGVTGSVVVEDGSGSVTIEDVTGFVTVEDGSGSLRVRNVGRDVVITDGSGSIEVTSVGGTVRVNGGGSGSVSVHDVDGDLVVTDTRRSRIRHSDIRGVLDLPPTGGPWMSPREHRERGGAGPARRDER